MIPNQVVKVTTLTPIEQSDFGALDEVVVKFRQAFLDVACALREILERRLYREDFPTFEAYCSSRGISRQHGYRLAAAHETLAAIQECNPAGDSEPATIPVPTSERQVRPLARLSGSGTAGGIRMAAPRARRLAF